MNETKVLAGAEQIPTTFYCIMLQSFAMETGQQNFRKFGDSHLVASRNISLQIAVGARAIIVRRRHHHERLSVGSEDQGAGRKPAR